MNALSRQISISILLVAVVSAVQAAPGHDRAYDRSNFPEGDLRLEGASESDRASSMGGAPWQSARPFTPESATSMESGLVTGVDGRRKGARMSPEERRALRRQIDEAGHDIYMRRP